MDDDKKATELHASLMRQLRTRIICRYINAKRNMGASILQLVCPFCMLCIFFSFTYIKIQDPMEIELSVENQYNKNMPIDDRVNIPYAFYGTDGDSTILTNKADGSAMSPHLYGKKTGDAVRGGEKMDFNQDDVKCMWDPCAYYESSGGGGNSDYEECPPENMTT